ncbi:uncharacterized protein LOC129892937 [Solanum dulcamara]|uniref:uncharacterized protein LOC129892937 n=1 Tax=Solanum dulcamara TaxID=45834 RepID=UPI0024853A8D|nr:uncharacterized protein LOC129892937 [Solanum dulcamara]
MEPVWLIQGRLLTAQSCQKSYADKRVRPLVFMVGDQVWLRVSPLKGVMRFGKKDESHVISHDSVELSAYLTYEEEPVAILDRQVRKLRTKEITSVNVQWQHRPVGEATWELESDTRARYPYLF